jgi:hypothetical protein
MFDAFPSSSRRPTSSEIAGAKGGLAMAGDLLRFKLSKNGTAETLSVAGELDISSAPAFEQAVSQALDGQGQELRST